MPQPWVRVAAMVVSEMNERLSPKKAPPTTMATVMAGSAPVDAAMPAAMGARATMVPTEVPIDRDMKQAPTKRPAGTMRPGRKWSTRPTVASMHPMLLAEAAKAPARMNIQIMSRIPGSAAPRENRSRRALASMPGTRARA